MDIGLGYVPFEKFVNNFDSCHWLLGQEVARLLGDVRLFCILNFFLILRIHKLNIFKYQYKSTVLHAYQ